MTEQVLLSELYLAINLQPNQRVIGGDRTRAPAGARRENAETN